MSTALEINDTERTALTVRIPTQQKEEFFRLCEDRGMNASALIRMWVRNYIRDMHEEEENS